MRTSLLVLGLAVACGGSQEPEPAAPPRSDALPSVPLSDNTPRPRPQPAPRPLDSDRPAPAAAAEDPGPPPPVDGVYSPLYLRANGMKLLDQRITVKGTVVWIYDCLEDLAAREPERSRAELRTRISRHPEQCKRPHFYLGDRKGTPRERAILVAEVPRPIRPDERISLTDAEVAAWPAVPSIAVGQTVTVEGTWALSSPRGYASPDGLLVYGRLVP